MSPALAGERALIAGRVRIHVMRGLLSNSDTKSSTTGHVDGCQYPRFTFRKRFNKAARTVEGGRNLL